MAYTPTAEDQARGASIRAFRRAYGMTEQQLADATGIGRRYLAYIEKGERHVNLMRCRKIADVLGVPLAAITVEAVRAAESAPDESAA